MEHEHPTYRLLPKTFERLDKFVEQFLSNGFETFAGEFDRVDKFVRQAVADRSERDDHSLRRSEKARYLLEMVSYRLYDRLNRDAFNAAKDTLIIMPDCLTLHNPECEKVDTKHGDICRRCLDDCQAAQLSRLARKHRIKVVFSKRKLSDQIEYYARKSGDLSVIGVACIMMLASGMRRATECGIPTRGVLLNYTGCDHWNETAFASAFAFDQIESILEEKHANRDS